MITATCCFAETICLALAIIHYPHVKTSYLKWFIPFLVCMFWGDLLLFYSDHFRVITNYLQAIVSLLFYSAVFYRLTDRQFLKTYITVLVSVCMMIYLVLYLFCSGYHPCFITGSILSDIFLFSTAFTYLYTRFEQEDVDLFHDPGCWIALGVAVCFFGSAVSLCFYEEIRYLNSNMIQDLLLSTIPGILRIVLYICISAAIFSSKKKKNI